ncbi:integrase core domain protein, partial [Lasius niger]
SIPPATRPFQKCAIDAVGPFLVSNKGNKWILVISDYFTRYAEAYAVPNIQSTTVATVLVDYISRHGLMDVLYSDRGTNFLSEAMGEVYKLLGIKKCQTVSYNPQGNGVVERVNKTLIEALSHLVRETQEDWCTHVPLALLAYRTAYHRILQETPAYLVYGRDLKLPYDLIYTSKFRSYADTRTYAQDLGNRMQKAFELVTHHLEKAAKDQTMTKSKRDYKKVIELGDVVYLHTPKIRPGLTKKLGKTNHGPFRVVAMKSPVVFEIMPITGTGKGQIVHMNRLI